jgi:hypothetical protein
MKTFGSRDEVHCGLAARTRYGLTKDDLIVSHGKVVSKKKHEMAMADKQAYLDKMNGPRRARRAPSVSRTSGPVESQAVTIQTNRPIVQQTPEARAAMLRAAIGTRVYGSY